MSFTLHPKNESMAAGSDLENRWTRVDGLHIYTRFTTAKTDGDRVPVVLVHGLGVSGAYWMPTASLLGDHFRVFVPDMPGFGDSDKPPHIPDLKELSDILLAWMDAEGLDRAALVGNSMGCQIAVNAALNHPHRVTRLVLQGPTIDPDARSASRQIGRLLLDGFVEPPSLLPLVARDYLKCGYRRIAGTLRHSIADPIEENLRQIHLPTMVVRGAMDPIVPQRWAEHASRLLPQGDLTVMPGGTHAVNFAQPRELTRIIRSFLTLAEGDASEAAEDRFDTF